MTRVCVCGGGGGSKGCGFLMPLFSPAMWPVARWQWSCLLRFVRGGAERALLTLRQTFSFSSHDASFKKNKAKTPLQICRFAFWVGRCAKCLRARQSSALSAAYKGQSDGNKAASAAGRQSEDSVQSEAAACRRKERCTASRPAAPASAQRGRGTKKKK